MPNPPVVPHSAEPPVLYDPPELTRKNWDRAGARLLAKLIGEFAYEEILRPLPVDRDAAVDAAPGRHPYILNVPSDDGSGSGRVRFNARRGAYGSWQVDPDSIEWVPGPGTADDATAAPSDPVPHAADDEAAASPDPEPEPGPHAADDVTAAPSDPEPFTDPLAFLLRTKHLIGLDGTTLGHLIRELSVTLAADARLDHTALTAPQLTDLGYAELEGHQTGHPWIVLNKGRLGFSATDASRWAPEARRHTSLPWIAVHTSLATYRGAAGLESADSLYSRELDAPIRQLFADSLRARGLDPAAYLYLPVHPWQWDDIVLPLFAHSVATDAIVPLPTDGDLRLPQQSIRTFLNTTHPERHTVKLPLSVLNTLVWRGLPTERTLAAPAVTTWMLALRDADTFLKDECGVILLGEVASVAVQHPVYGDLDEVPYQYKELLGAIWREPVTRHLASGERARTLASLLLVDPQGRSFTAELVARSGLDAKTWLRRLFAALLPPLLRFLYRYGTVFSPHGENAIVVFDEQDVPVRLAVKDFVDDVNVSGEPLPEHDSMPQDVRDVLLTERPDFLTQFIHSGLFIGVFRYLAPLCEEQLGVPEAQFWFLVRAEILRHHARFPELKERYEMFDLLTPRIERLCLNRNRLHLDGYRDRAHRPHAAVHGTVANPLHQP
ncbi:IucA/IucC family siderophore biosynthesis protein [Streptomyces kunmingensis]|uniref:IucA/IucC family siderophore biosynthesis protein n=1 Tax=Streptomyces kunmingensis TaxID=68225 RepID=A0ABU6CAU8_9ACTN|nr:IucA/IucC family protein [Streptomyces kunmingensis]MEB3961752.1 IucA/IucC family siderophore biosynthesis protein [Streptomyces kunmingensis]